jgi:hypothetical protein
MTKNAERREKFRKLGRGVSTFISDPQVGLCKPHPWKVKKSGGYDVLQIVSDPGQSKLERRSQEQPA